MLTRVTFPYRDGGRSTNTIGHSRRQSATIRNLKKKGGTYIDVLQVIGANDPRVNGNDRRRRSTCIRLVQGVA